MLEEAEKRDHRRLGREMNLFHFQEEGPGVVFWHAKGWRMFQTLLTYMRRRIDRELRRGERTSSARQGAVGNVGPLGLVQGTHVRHRDGRRPGVCNKTNELPGSCANFQAWSASLLPELPWNTPELGNPYEAARSAAAWLMRVRGFARSPACVFQRKTGIRVPNACGSMT